MKTNMNVSFTGYKNVAGMVYGAGSLSDPNISANTKVVFQVDNNGTKDLDEMQEVFKRFKDPVQNNFLSVESTYSENAKGQPIEKILVNGSELEFKDENFSVIRKVQNALNKIKNSETPFPLSRDYLESEDCAKNIFGDANIAGVITQDKTIRTQEEMLERLHSKEFFQKTSSLILEQINKNIKKLFNIV